jgi:hypothetical protein
MPAKAAPAQLPNAKVDDASSMSVFNEPLPLLKSSSTISQSPAQSPVAPSTQVQAVQSAKVVQPTKTPVRLLAIPANNSVVVTDPTTRLPVVIKVGEALPDGSTLKSADKASSTALTSRGESISLQ